jgi:transporter family protein
MIMKGWVIIGIFVMFLWGIGSFFGKIALLKDTPYRVYLFEGMGTLVVLTVFVLLKRSDIFTDFHLNYPALLMGLSWGVGTVLFILALDSVRLSVFVPLTALYPAVTVLLSVAFLKEELELREAVGVFLAIISVLMLSR